MLCSLSALKSQFREARLKAGKESASSAILKVSEREFYRTTEREAGWKGQYYIAQSNSGRETVDDNTDPTVG